MSGLGPFIVAWTCETHEWEQTTKVLCESNVDVRRAVGRPGAIWLDRVKKACSAMSQELKDANLSARPEWREIMNVMNVGMIV